ncbi:MAG: TonB-dependent receptor [Flavobacteriales bacterium]|nr:TonB-dependent receptor [Flavobacteriales bacterium]
MNKLLFLFISISNIIISQNSFNTDSVNILKEINATYYAHKETPITYQNININEIQEQYIGQEPAFILNQTPSIIGYSDGGHSQGYAYFTLRGIDQTRVNITLDGVPLNDPADQAFYFSNYADILNSIQTIQIQRGVGTSKNGTASYAGNIELFSHKLNKNNKEIGFGYGSYNTLRAYGIYNTTKNNKSLHLRISKIYSDGFKQHSSNNSQSLFLSGGWTLNKSIWKINILSGNQKNELAWMAVSENEINCDRTINANSQYEKDDFSQTLFQIQHIFSPKDHTTIHSSIYSTLANGWWDFDLPNFLNVAEPSDIEDISRNTLNSQLLGLYSNYTIKHNNLKSITGFHGNVYQNNFQESHMLSGVIWNENTKYKNEISLFQKIEYRLNKLLILVDVQSRKSWFDYQSNLNFSPISWSFINPKVGLSYNISPKNILYCNIGKTGREPARYDMFEGNDVLLYLCEYDNEGNIIIPESGNTLIQSTLPEYVVDYELGVRSHLERLILNINYYYLNFDNERVLNGFYGPNGLALSSNVDKSVRTGIELFASYNINDHIKLINNSSYNYSIIQEQNIQFTPILTPPIIINQEVVYEKNNLKFSLSGRYQSESYINFENTASLNDYIIINSRIDYKIKNYSASIFINNITDNFYFNHGFIDASGNEKYFVQTPRNIHLAFKIRF